MTRDPGRVGSWSEEMTAGCGIEQGYVYLLQQTHNHCSTTIVQTCIYSMTQERDTEGTVNSADNGYYRKQTNNASSSYCIKFQF